MRCASDPLNVRAGAIVIGCGYWSAHAGLSAGLYADNVNGDDARLVTAQTQRHQADAVAAGTGHDRPSADRNATAAQVAGRGHLQAAGQSVSKRHVDQADTVIGIADGESQ